MEHPIPDSYTRTINVILNLSDYVYKIDHGKIIKSGEAGTVLGKASEDAVQKIPAKISSVNGSELSIIYSEENKAEKGEFQPGEEIYIIKKPLV